MVFAEHAVTCGRQSVTNKSLLSLVPRITTRRCPQPQLGRRLQQGASAYYDFGQVVHTHVPRRRQPSLRYETVKLSTCTFTFAAKCRKRNEVRRKKVLKPTLKFRIKTLFRTQFLDGPWSWLTDWNITVCFCRVFFSWSQYQTATAIFVITELKLSKILRPTRHKISHFGDALTSQTLSSAVKKTKLQKAKLEITKPKWSTLTQKYKLNH